MFRKILALLTSILFMVCIPTTQVFAVYDYSSNENKSNIINYVGNYDEVLYPQKNLNAVFTDKEINVDGEIDEAWANAPASSIVNEKNVSEYILDKTGSASGVLRTMWDGSVLYLLVEVKDNTPERGNQETSGAMTAKPAVPKDRDSVTFAFDFYNDKTPYETDTAGVFNISSNGELSYFRNSNIPSLSSIFDPTSPEHAYRLKSYASKDVKDADGNVIGYNVEVAIQIENLGIKNGKQFGIDVQICDVDILAEHDEVTTNWWGGTETTHAAEGPGRARDIFWSHNQDSLYSEYDHERPNSVDWGNVTLTGWDGKADFAYSDWRLSSSISYLDSISFPKGVYTDDSQEALDAARKDAEIILQESADGIRDKTQTDETAERLEAAIAGLRWADTKYPDPDEYEDQATLPNPYKFFGSERLVKSNEDWEERREEILDLAQFYEYGYKPGAPDKMEIIAVQHYNENDQTGIGWFGPTYATCAQDKFTVAITVGEKTVNIEYTVYLPTTEQLAASGHADEPVPVMLSFGGDIAAYREAGIAVVSIPAVASDTRTNEYAWGNRTGAFYELYPYSRNGEEALNEVSVTMAHAWAATRIIDALEMMEDCTIEGVSDIAKAIDPSKLAVTGFSYQGKYAFLAAVYDERIDVCVPGAAGASGPSTWRYVYWGQEHDFTNTIFAPTDLNASAKVVAFGTETICNSVRHNRVRETELFRQFLNLGHMYDRLEGAYGYGTRLPYDQNDLVATLAPRAIVLESTVNDYNDGSVADCLSLTIAKSVYENLGCDADNLVKYNLRPVVTVGDPHGSDDAQHARTAEYLNYYFYGEKMSSETAEWLNTDPFNMTISNNQTESPYDYYWGGFNTITGGDDGVDGRDGWYYYTFPSIESEESTSSEGKVLSDSDVTLTSDGSLVDGK